MCRDVQRLQLKSHNRTAMRFDLPGTGIIQLLNPDLTQASLNLKLHGMQEFLVPLQLYQVKFLLGSFPENVYASTFSLPAWLYLVGCKQQISAEYLQCAWNCGV